MALNRLVNGVSVELAADEEAAQLAEWSANDPAKQPPPPDVAGFREAIKADLGGIVAANALAKAYPLFYPALERGVWTDLQALILDAKATLALSPVQYAAFQTLAAKYHLPITLP